MALIYDISKYSITVINNPIIIIFISNIDDVVDILETGKFQGNIILLIGTAILILDAIYNLLVWRKTYISIQDGTIVLERNTINKGYVLNKC